MEIGRLNRRITVTPTGTKASDGAGGYTVTPGTPFDTWCGAKQMSMDEVLRVGLQVGEATYKFQFRYEIAKDVTQAYSFTYEDRDFHPVGINEVDEDKRVIQVIANERTN